MAVGQAYSGSTLGFLGTTASARVARPFRRMTSAAWAASRSPQFRLTTYAVPHIRPHGEMLPLQAQRHHEQTAVLWNHGSRWGVKGRGAAQRSPSPQAIQFLCRLQAAV